MSEQTDTEKSLSVYQSYSSIWRDIDNREYHSLAAHPQLLNKINERAYNGYTPLFLACLRQDTRIIKFLLEMGAEPNAGNTTIYAFDSI
jgi:ankyrin repeat protein